MTSGDSGDPGASGASGAGERLGVYPGSFNPPTIAHLAIAEAAVRQHGLNRLDWVVSEVALAKEDVQRPRMADRLGVLQKVAASRSWLGVAVTSHQLLADIAEGYDLLVVGADKWEQIQQDRWYESAQAKREAFERLPEVTVAPRPPFAVPADRALDLTQVMSPAEASRIAEVSSSVARQGRTAWMLPEAQEFDENTGAWSGEERYDQWSRRAN